MKDSIHVGDRVIVPWGLETVEGVVLEIFGPAARPTALVAVQFTGSEDVESDDDPPTIPLPVASLELIEPATA